MKIVSALIIITAFFASSAFAQRVPIKNVAVVETEIDEGSGAASEINRAEVRGITGEIRRTAVNNLPRGRFNVMTSETVLAMGPAVLEDCADENCVIALGSKIGADYIVRGIISKFAGDLTVTVEMYETEYGMLVATADPVRTTNLRELLEKTTVVCAAMYKKFLETSSPPAPQAAAASAPAAPPAPVVTPPPPPRPAAYTLTVNANQRIVGGTVTRSPNQARYAAGTEVTITAIPDAGYRFTGWQGGIMSNSSVVTHTMNSNLWVTANFAKQREKAGPAEPKPDRPRKHSAGLSWSGHGLEPHLRIGMSTHRRFYSGLGWCFTGNFGMDDGYYHEFDGREIHLGGFMEWHTNRNLLNVYGGPGLMLGYYSYEGWNGLIDESGVGIVPAAQGGAELRFGWFLLGVDMRLGYYIRTLSHGARGSLGGRIGVAF